MRSLVKLIFVNFIMPKEHAIFMPRECLKKDFPSGRLYIGSHTCAHHMPDISKMTDILKHPLTLVIPITPHGKLEYIKNYIAIFLKTAKAPEIVFNDIGILHWFSKEEQWKHVPKILGFLLTHQRRDPYFSIFHDDPNMNAVVQDNTYWIDVLRKYGISAVEITATIQPPLHTQFKKNNISVHTYSPFSFFSTTRYCPLLMIRKNKVHNALPLSCDIQNCGHEYFFLDRPVEQQKIRHYYIGNAQYYEQKDTIPLADRIIDNSLLIEDKSPPFSLNIDNIEEKFKEMYEEDSFLMQFPDAKHWYPETGLQYKIYDPVDIYIHIPFCESRCFYCEFMVAVGADELKKNEYLRYLEKEIGSALPHKIIPQTLYIGGGTPSSLSLRELQILFDILEQKMDIKHTEEISFEGNPASLSSEKISFLLQKGVNRLSIGVQSFQPDILKKIGRNDTVPFIHEILKNARKAGVNNNADMMYGFSGQTVKDIERDLENLILYSPEHITLYPLFIKKGSLAEKKLGKISLEELKRLYLAGSNFLRNKGYIQYSKEYFVKDVKYIHQYQDNYLQGKDIAAFGLRGRSYIDGTYSLNPSMFQEYYKNCDGNRVCKTVYRLNVKEKITKDIVLGIKRATLDISALEKKHDMHFLKQYGALLEVFLKKKWVIFDQNTLSLSHEGMFYDNYIARSFTNSLK